MFINADKSDSYDRILFIDESGSENIVDLEKEGVSSIYIVGALIVDANKVDAIENEFKKIADKEFQNEMKSSHIKNNLSRRMKILDELFSVSGYTVDILVVNKSKLHGGYEYSKSFVKNIHIKLYDSFKSQMCNILIVSDQIKQKRFNDEFERYVYKNLENSLWSKRDKITIDSKKSFCIQAIDFIVGSILRGYEYCDEYSDISNHIPKDSVAITYFPDHKPQYLFELDVPENEEYNRDIAEEAVAIANKYVQDNREATEESIKVRVGCLERLTREYVFGERKSWIQADELLSYVNIHCKLDKSKDSLRYHIGKLKEQGVLIASKADGGYKLPCSVKDMELFINNLGFKIVPMIDRMKKARDIIKKSSVFNYDIVEDKPIYKQLITAYEEVKDQEIVVSEED